MNHITRFGGASRRSHPWVLLAAIAIVFAGVLALGQTRFAAVSEGKPANIETARQFFNLLNDEHAVSTMELFTDAAAIHTPEGEFQGPIGAGEFVSALRDAFPTASFTISYLDIVDDTVIALCMMTGRQYEDYHGHTSSCAGVTISGSTISRFEDRLIAEQWIHYDRLALINQIESFNQIDAASRPGCRNR